MEDVAESTKRLKLLRESVSKSMGNWMKLLTEPLPRADLFDEAFPSSLNDLRVKDKVSRPKGSSGVFPEVIKATLPTLVKAAPAAASKYPEDITNNVVEALKEEVDEMIRDHHLAVKFASLEKMQAELERAKRDKTAYRPAIAHISPEAEIRSETMKHKIAYRSALAAEVARLSAECATLQTDVESHSARAAKVRTGVAAHLGKLKPAADAATRLMEGGHGGQGGEGEAGAAMGGAGADAAAVSHSGGGKG